MYTYHSKPTSNTRSISNSKWKIDIRTWSVKNESIRNMLSSLTFFVQVQNDLDQILKDLENFLDFYEYPIQKSKIMTTY